MTKGTWGGGRYGAYKSGYLPLVKIRDSGRPLPFVLPFPDDVFLVPLFLFPSLE